jgi:hypothetical protein
MHAHGPGTLHPNRRSKASNHPPDVIPFIDLGTTTCLIPATNRPVAEIAFGFFPVSPTSAPCFKSAPSPLRRVATVRRECERIDRLAADLIEVTTMVTLGFWIIKIFAITLGEVGSNAVTTFADMPMPQNLNSGSAARCSNQTN